MIKLPEPERNYVYVGTSIKNFDGDTLTALIDQGFRDYTTRQLRLAVIDTPERRTPTLEEGRMVQKIVEDKLKGKTFTLQTDKDKTGTFNRYIAHIWIDGEHLNYWLYENGYAVIWTP